ncbi:MAG: mechanosensitive ion channel [Armatimonadetes bacterium]|nr:mechanosensitive ion channel [Armatimonadota bacterium]
MNWMQQVLDWATRPLVEIGAWEVTALNILALILLPVAVFLVARTVRRVLLNRVLKRSPLDRGMQNTIATMTYYVLLFVGLLAVLSSIGINITSLTVFTGALGLGVGIGLQEVARNFISGLVLLMARPIKPGDRIEVGDLEGDIRRIGTYSTIVVTLDDAAVIVPNSWLLENNLVNWTHTGERRRLRIPIGVHYNSDPALVRTTLLQVAEESPDVIAEPKPEVLLTEFGDSSVNFELLVWTHTHVFRPRLLRSKLYFAIHAALKENEIEIPYPQRDLHIRSSAVALS